MNTIQGKRLTLGIAATCMGLEVALLAASSHVFGAPHKHHIQPPQEVSETLSWYEAQQRKYQRQERYTGAPSSTLQQPQATPTATTLDAEQENKVLTMMRLLTLDFSR